VDCPIDQRSAGHRLDRLSEARGIARQQFAGVDRVANERLVSGEHLLRVRERRPAKIGIAQVDLQECERVHQLFG
jgi:hypothetical protein